MLVVVALMHVVDVARLVAVVLVRVALMRGVGVILGVVLVLVALVLGVDVARLVAVVLVAVTFVGVVLLHLVSFLYEIEGQLHACPNFP